jgi:hypothetical protein
MKNTRHPRCARHRFPAEVISYAVWLYFRFPLSLRMVEEMLAARGILVSHETVRQWALKFGQSVAKQIHRRLPAPGDKWHLDEVVISIAGQKHWQPRRWTNPDRQDGGCSGDRPREAMASRRTRVQERYRPYDTRLGSSRLSRIGCPRGHLNTPYRGGWRSLSKNRVYRLSFSRPRSRQSQVKS